MVIDRKSYKGTLSVGDNWCEVRCKKANMILPRKKLKFEKTIRYFDSIRYEGQNGMRGTEVNYYAIIKRYSKEDIQRFKQWKN